MNEVVKILSGDKVYLSDPNAESMKQFLGKVNDSRGLHDPWVSPPSDESEYAGYIERTRKENQRSFFVRLESGELVGVININEIVRGCFQSGYLGFYAFSGYEGRGLMSEGLRLVIRYAFNNLKLHRLEANIQAENIKSILCVRRQHFRHEGVSLNYLKIKGEWRNHERFAMTTEDYEKIKN